MAKGRNIGTESLIDIAIAGAKEEEARIAAETEREIATSGGDEKTIGNIVTEYARKKISAAFSGNGILSGEWSGPVITPKKWALEKQAKELETAINFVAKAKKGTPAYEYLQQEQGPHSSKDRKEMMKEWQADKRSALLAKAVVSENPWLEGLYNPLAEAVGLLVNVAVKSVKATVRALVHCWNKRGEVGAALVKFAKSIANACKSFANSMIVKAQEAKANMDRGRAGMKTLRGSGLKATTAGLHAEHAATIKSALEEGEATLREEAESRYVEARIDILAREQLRREAWGMAPKEHAISELEASIKSNFEKHAKGNGRSANTEFEKALGGGQGSIRDRLEARVADRVAAIPGERVLEGSMVSKLKRSLNTRFGRAS